MDEIAAAHESLKRRIMPEAVLVCAVRLPLMPEPSRAVSNVLGLFGATERLRRGPVLSIVD